MPAPIAPVPTTATMAEVSRACLESSATLVPPDNLGARFSNEAATPSA